MKRLSPTHRWDATPPEVWKQWQLHHLKAYLQHRVLPFSAHYHRLSHDLDFHPGDLHSLEDWAKFPLSSKADLTGPPEALREFVLTPDPAVLRKEWSTIFHALLHGPKSAKAELEREFRPLLLTSTTGRSSDPVPFLYTAHDLDVLSTAGRRMMECGRSQPDFRHLNLFPYAPHLAFWQAHHASMAFGAFMVSSGGGKTIGTEGNLRLLGKIKPHIIIGMPTFIYHLMHEAAEHGMKVPDLKRIVLGGEKTAPGLRAKLRDLAHELDAEAHIISTYGFTEAKMAFPECTGPTAITATGYHLSPDLGLIEIIDPKTGALMPDGHPGEIVFTPLEARGTVVLRYRTGDLAEGGMTWETCPHCGRTCPRIIGPISRVSDIKSMSLDKVKGTLVDFNVMEHLLDDQTGIAAWQMELTKRDGDPMEVDELHLHVAKDPGLTDREVESLVMKRFQEGCEVTPNAIHFHDFTDLRERLGVGRLLKEEKIVDHRLQATQ